MSVFDLSQTEAIAGWLATTALFQGLAPDHLMALATITRMQHSTKGQAIFWEGDPCSGFFIVQNGRVKIFKGSPEGKEQILHFVNTGEHFAEVAAFDGLHFPASAVALEPTNLLCFPRPAFLQLLEQQPRLAINLLAIFARHLRRFTHLVDHLSLKEVPQRLAYYLLQCSEQFNHSDVLALDISKGQLAALLGTIPETLSRAFYKLSHDQMIEMQGSQIRLVDRPRLLALSVHRDK